MTVTSHSALARQDALRQIELKIKLKLDGLIAGEHQGLLPGLGSELGETRPYQAGDDVRRIDWNVSARLGSVYTRGTIIDHELDTWIVAGISARTWFGTSQYLKSELTLAAVATFGQLGLRMKSRVGAIVAGPKNLKSHRPSKTRGQLHKILTSIDEARPADGTGPADLLQGLTELRKLTSRRSLIVIVSDFVDSNIPFAAFRELALRNYVFCVQLQDPAEISIPNIGIVDIEDPATGRQTTVDTSSEKVRTTYAEAASARQQELELRLRQTGCRHMILNTESEWVDQIISALLLNKKLDSFGRGSGASLQGGRL